MNTVEAAWLAGILEGEGCFDYNGNVPKKWPKVRVEMKDEDVILRVQVLTGGSVRMRPARKPQHSNTFVLQIAKHSDVEKLLQTIRPFMGERRGRKIDEQLSAIQVLKSRVIAGPNPAYRLPEHAL